MFSQKTAHTMSAVKKALISVLLRYGLWTIAIIYLLIYLVDLPLNHTILDFFMAHSTQNVLSCVALVVVLLGFYDLSQRKHSILRNYPVMGHFRWLFEAIRPEIRQYLLETDHESVPFSREQRSLVYRRSKNVSSDRPFGTIEDTYRDNHEYMAHSLQPVAATDINQFKVRIGNDACRQPYLASVFNISAMSFGSLSANAILALNKGAKLGGFYHDTGEGSISPYHLEGGGDIVWEIGSGYFGCRDDQGRFDAEKFRQQVQLPIIKMIEIKLSQGAKPGHGGILPKEKITPLIARVRGIRMDEDCVSPSAHSAFSTPLELMAFIQQLRDLSAGKPVGIKLCIGQPWEFMGIVKAMLETRIYPDFIVIDGAEGGTGAAPIEFSDHLGMPLREGLLFAHNVLMGAGVRQHIKLAASGKIISAFDILRVMALGADWVNSARGFMFALGCIQSQQCHTNQCPVGVATQDKHRQKALVVTDKTQRVYQFHRNTLKALSEMLAAAGLRHPGEVKPKHLVRRINTSEIKSYQQLLYFVTENGLIDGQERSSFYTRMWAMADSGCFGGRSAAL
ncbi:FMN-binding glutamate synthase family protein [Neisseriaceae bacterium ESL0693]|nr:FMN-binding glutamate synthase family protein [Neisseriaceae bacterium ESL0693]